MWRKIDQKVLGFFISNVHFGSKRPIKKANFGKILGNFSEMNFKEGYFKGLSIY